MGQRPLVSRPNHLLFHELHLHERAPRLVWGPFLSGDEVHRQDVLVGLCAALAFLVVPEQTSIASSVGPAPLVEEQRVFPSQSAWEFGELLWMTAYLEESGQLQRR